VKGSGFVKRPTGHALPTGSEITPSKTTKPLSSRFEPRVTRLSQQPSGGDEKKEHDKTLISRQPFKKPTKVAQNASIRK
jgi:hypothetical protein